jgi:hypothetical protein
LQALARKPASADELREIKRLLNQAAAPGKRASKS